MVQETSIVLRDKQIEFRVFIYRKNGETEPIGTIEGIVIPETNQLASLFYTDAVSGKSTEMKGLRGEV